MTDGPAPALEARGLDLSWGDGARVIARDISFEVGKGQTVCIVGRSGCGKTTVLHGLSGLLRPLSGSVLVHGRDVTGEPGHVSYMLQKDLLLPHLRIIDNACLPLRLAGVPRDEARDQARALFERFGLAGTEDAWPTQLSGGMRQRAAFLRTYLMGHDVVLLDEPFSALDALTRRDLRTWYVDMVAELGLASVVITHDVDEAVSLADLICVLRTEATGTEKKPSRIVARIDVPRDADARDFELSHAYIDCKREVLAQLG